MPMAPRLYIPLVKAGPYVGPRGGLWADPAHTIPWKQKAKKQPPKRKLPLSKVIEQGKTFPSGSRNKDAERAWHLRGVI